MGTRLYRSRRDRMLAGVAGGLAEMWGADPTLVRLIWALLVIFTGGIALVVYIVMAVVIPEEEEVYPGGVPTRKLNAGVTTAGASRGSGITPAVLVGGFLVVLGGFFLISRIPTPDRFRLVLAADPCGHRRGSDRRSDG